MRLSRWMLMLVLAPMLVTATLLTVFFVSARLSALEDSLQGKGRALVLQLAGSSELGLFSGNRELVEAAAASVMRDADVAAAIVRDDAGVVYARLGSDAAATLAISGRRSGDFLVLNEPVRRNVTPLDDLFSDGRHLTTDALGTVTIVLSTSALRQTRLEVVATALLVTGGLSALVWFMVQAYVRRFNRRLIALSDAVEKVGAGDLAAEIGDAEGAAAIRVNELDTLASGINAMTRQIALAHHDLAYRIAEATAELDQRRADAERANQAKSRFLAAASHDLRQPLHALGLFADQLARRELGGEDGRLVSRIVESSGTLSELIDALLDISRLDAGAMRAKISPIPLAPMLRRLHADFEVQAAQRGLMMSLRSRDVWVAADSMMLERVLINLLGNALRYTESGTVMLAARRGSAGRVRVEVRDSGIGIREDAQRLIFDEFVQLANPERDHVKGLGLGLSIVARMCQLMNCRYGVRSRPGRGSVFWIELPITTAQADPVPLVGASDRRLEGRFVVVIDDDPLGLESLCDQLRSWGCKVCAGASGDQLMADLDRLGAIPNVILCDHRLGSGEHGEAVVTRLRVRYGTSIPAVLITGDTGMQLRDGVGSNNFPVLSKPVRPARLRAVLQGVLSGNSAS